MQGLNRLGPATSTLSTPPPLTIDTTQRAPRRARRFLCANRGRAGRRRLHALRPVLCCC